MCVIDFDDGDEAVRQKIVESDYSRLVVCRDGLEHILGVLQKGDLLKRAVPGQPIGIADIEPCCTRRCTYRSRYRPPSCSRISAIARLQFALIVDEYGEVEGW